MTRQISRAESWEKTYQAFQDINFSAFDFFTVKSSLIDYLRLHFPESFNDFIESSELIAIIELFAYMAELVCYRLDMNAHENFISTAQRKDSVLRLAKLVSYNASRNIPLRGLMKITQVATTESIIDSSGASIAGQTIVWNDSNNDNWKEHFLLVMNAVLEQPFGTVLPTDRVQVDDVLFELYTLNNKQIPGNNIPFTAITNGTTVNYELVPTSLDENGPFERRPERTGQFSVLYGSDGVGDSSDYTGFFTFFKQGRLQKQTITFNGVTPNQSTTLGVDNINEIDVWVNQIDPETGSILKDRNVDLLGRYQGYQGEWEVVDSLASNVLFNTNTKRNKYELETLINDRVRVIFGDGEFSDIPNGTFDIWFRTSVNDVLVLPKAQVINRLATLSYTDSAGLPQTFSFYYSLTSNVANNTPSEDIEAIRRMAPAVYYTQDRMVNPQDYNTYPLQDPSILKLKTVNRTFIGDSKYITWHDASSTYEDVKLFGNDLKLFYIQSQKQLQIAPNSSYDDVIKNNLQPVLSYNDVRTFHIDNNINTTRVVLTESEITQISNTIDNAYVNINSAFPIKIAQINKNTKSYLGLNFSSDALDSANLDGNDVVINAGSRSYLTNVTVDDVLYSFTLQAVDVIEGGDITLTSLAAGLNLNFINGSIPARAFVKGSVIYLQTESTGINSNISFQCDALLDSVELVYFQSISPSVNGVATNTWVGYNSNTPLLTAHTFEVTYDGVYWEVDYNSLQLMCESDATKFWYSNKLESIINGDTLNSVHDKVILLGANINNNRNGILSTDIELNVEGIDVQTTMEQLGLPNLNRLKLTTTDVTGDLLPDDVLLRSNLLDVVDEDIVVYAQSPSSLTLNGAVYNIIELSTDIIAGYDEIAIINGSGQKLVPGVDFIEIDDESGTLPVIGSTINLIAVLEEYYVSSLVVRYVDYLYYAKYDTEITSPITFEADSVYRYVDFSTLTEEDVNNWKALWYSEQDSETPNVVRYRGRSNLNFMWLYNTPNYNLVNPSPTNIHDMIVITRGYYQQLLQWLRGAADEPSAPTPYELRNAYSKLLKGKMMSDTVVMHSGEIKVIIGSKAIPELRAKIKIIKDVNSKLSNNEIKVKIVAIVREFFDITYWEFGENFSFSELAAVIHGQLTNDVNSVALVPLYSGGKFGDMYQIYAKEDEIIQPDISVNDIEIVAAFNATNLKQV